MVGLIAEDLLQPNPEQDGFGDQQVMIPSCKVTVQGCPCDDFSDMSCNQAAARSCIEDATFTSGKVMRATEATNSELEVAVSVYEQVKP